MKNYERPVMIRTEELAEGVYLASGGIKCDSVYMNGVWQAPDYSDWNGTTRGYKQQSGCLGCPANTASGCGRGRLVRPIRSFYKNESRSVRKNLWLVGFVR